MKLKAFLLAAVLALAVTPSFAQSLPTRTTLTAAVSSGPTNNTIPVASVTGMSGNVAGPNNFIMVDHELMLVRSVNSTALTLTVARSQGGTLGVGHNSGATVIYGAGGTFNTKDGSTSGLFFNGNNAAALGGSCTRNKSQIVPVFGISPGFNNGYTYDCLGGAWVQGTFPDDPDPNELILAMNIPVGPVAYASIGTNTAGIATQEWLTSIDVPQTGFITGVKVLAGGTATTDNILVVLRDGGGNVIATSALAGQVLSGANTFQTVPFTAPTWVVGKGRYFVGVQTSGATAGDIQTISASTYPNIFATALTGGTFGTIVNPATMPSTFTAGKGPVVMLYY